MSCDIDYRYRRALQPDGLSTYETALRAVNDAIADVKLAGRDVATCPAVLLLTRHLARIAEGVATLDPVADRALRDQCIARLAELKNSPAIVALVRRGVDYKTEELRHYRREGSRTLRLIAGQLGLDHSRRRSALPETTFWKDRASICAFLQSGTVSPGWPGAIPSGSHRDRPFARPRSRCCATFQRSQHASRAN